MSELWNDYLGPHPFDYSLVRDSPTTYVLRVTRTAPEPPELSVLFGEWLYNMRSALDYTIWAAALYASGQTPPPGEGGLQYPIYDEAAAWKNNLWRLKPLADHHREMLLTMQPFNSNLDANFLGWINRLARIDRHRRLAIWTARIAETNPVFKVPGGETPKMEWGQRVFYDGVCDHARLTFSSAEAADGIEVNPRSGIDPEIKEWSDSTFWGRYRFSDRLKLMYVFVKGEVGLYEYDCTGASDTDMASDTFKAESDARRAGGLFPPLAIAPAPTVHWVSAGEAAPSTDAKFRGLDFPREGPGPATR